MYYYDRDTQQPDSCCTNWLDSEGRVVRSVRSTLRDDGTWALDGSSIETCTYDETVEYYPNTNKVSSRTKTRDSSDPASAESSTTIYDEQGFPVPTPGRPMVRPIPRWQRTGAMCPRGSWMTAWTPPRLPPSWIRLVWVAVPASLPGRVTRSTLALAVAGTSTISLGSVSERSASVSPLVPAR